MRRIRTRGPVIGSLLIAALAAVPSAALGVGKGPGRDGDRLTDGRARAGLPATAAARAAIARNGSAAVRRYAATLGNEAIVSLDPTTNTPRVIARTDGFLTTTSTKPAARIALDYLARHLHAFGLTTSDLHTLSLRNDYISIDGTHHLSYVQSLNGIPVANHGLRANITHNGRLINLLDAPLHNLHAATTTPTLTAWQARDLARHDLGAPTQGKIAIHTRPGAQHKTLMAGGDHAGLVLYHTTTGTHLAWQTFVKNADGKLVRETIDSTRGTILERTSLSDSITGLAWAYYPTAPKGGAQVSRDFSGLGWLPAGAPILSGNNTHTFGDVNDDNVAQPGEEIRAQASGNFDFVYRPFQLPGLCPNPCSWDSSTPFSWQRNFDQGGTQVFFFVNAFHDHLAAPPIGFTEAAGDFQTVNFSGQGKGGDAVQSQTDDGASTDPTTPGLPDGNHIDNANMDTPPDGTPPTMQMFLNHVPGTTLAEDPYFPAREGDDGITVYHEYTHGLSNRLVVDPLGNSTLGNFQAGAMGEAWSDWYAFDFLNAQGFAKDTSKPGELDLDIYEAPGIVGIARTEAIDCPVGQTSPFCPNGGYTYGDYGTVFGVPEVHADGEIWGQTLWDLRTALGSRLTESLLTRAMELSPTNPSFLDERNAILQADVVVNGGRAHRTIWRVFAHRGMGFFAAAVSGDDVHPVASFALPPSGGPRASVHGRVTDARTGTGIAGALVAFGGHASGFGDDLADAADGFGFYRVNHIPVGTYRDLFAASPGYDTKAVTLRVRRGSTARSFALTRDWAAGPGGASVTTFDGPDTEGCGPGNAIDQTVNGWESTTDLVNGVATPKSITIQLPQAIDVNRFGVDPSNNCVDAGSASTGAFRLETSTDGERFTTAASGTFTAADRKLNLISPSGGTRHRVRFVRFWMLGTQVPAPVAQNCAAGGFDGCTFMDMTELEVYGSPSR